MSELSRRIVYSCPFVPAEWIAAHGLIPSKLKPESVCSSSIGVGAGVCSYAKAFAETVIADTDARAVVVTTLCDQMRRISEVIAANIDMPVFLMHVPTTWESTNAQRMYMCELERLGRFMVGLGGRAPSREHLVDVMKEYDSARARLRDARGTMSGREYAELLTAFHRDMRLKILNPKPSPLPRGMPLALVGGPLLTEHMPIFDMIETSGGSVVLDATESGERGLPAPFDRRRIADEPFAVLADAYFGSIPDASRRPNSLLYRWLSQEIDARGVKGVVLVRHVWCDAWHAEASRMKDWLGLPFFDLDVGELGSDKSRMLTRLQAFMEIVS